jgi:DNA-binding NtrC family response regulator
LLVSADASLIEAVQEVIDSIGNLELVVAPGASEAHHDVVETDLALVLIHQESVGGLEEVTRLLGTIRETRRLLPALVLSNRHRAEEALVLLRSGVADYLCRPLDLSRLTYLIDVLTLRTRLARPGGEPALPKETEPRLLPLPLPLPLPPPLPLPLPRPGVSRLVVEPQPVPLWERMMEQVRRVAAQESTILLGGETGTGKTRLARLIHEMSPRRDLPFLVVNCGALSASLIESELFGHMKGAFTGADCVHTGKFAEVGRGTLLLDEIDALPPALQAKLLRAVEERLFEPVGSNQSLPVQARLIAASNRALDQEAAANRFRFDLYYRLNVISFTLPPLRDRRETIARLAGDFIAEFASRSGREVQGIAPEALQALEAHGWPGNIRELRNVIERAVVLSVGREIQLDDMPEHVQFPRNGHGHGNGPATLAFAPSAHAHVGGGGVRSAVCTAPGRAAVAAPTLARTKDHAELVRITDALQRHQNNRLRAAEELGISRMTLYKKLHKYGLMGTA